MSLLEGLMPPKPNYTCKIRSVAQELSEKDAQIFLDAVNDEQNWTVNALNRALAGRGIKVSCDAITRHRKRVCNCSTI